MKKIIFIILYCLNSYGQELISYEGNIANVDTLKKLEIRLKELSIDIPVKIIFEEKMDYSQIIMRNFRTEEFVFFNMKNSDDIVQISNNSNKLVIVNQKKANELSYISSIKELLKERDNSSKFVYVFSKKTPLTFLKYKIAEGEIYVYFNFYNQGEVKINDDVKKLINNTKENGFNFKVKNNDNLEKEYNLKIPEKIYEIIDLLETKDVIVSYKDEDMKDYISPQTIRIIKKAGKNINLNKLHISSGIRPPEKQVEIMFKNAIKEPQKQLDLYKNGGGKQLVEMAINMYKKDSIMVVNDKDTSYVKDDEDKKELIKKMMLDRLIELENKGIVVSRHSVSMKNYKKHNAVDIPSSYIKTEKENLMKRFTKELKKFKATVKVLVESSPNNCVHIEIKIL